MKRLPLKFITGFGLITILVLQSVWLHNTYTLIENDIKEKSDIALEKAIDLEVINRLRQLPNKPSTITAGALEVNGKVVNQCIYLQETLTDLNQPISLAKLDSVFNSVLSDANIHTNVALSKISIDKDSILYSTQKARPSSWGIITTSTVSIRLDNSEGIQAILINPYWIIFERMGLLLIATALMMFFVVGCIIYQIKIIAEQNQIAKIREGFSNAMIHDMKAPLSTILMGVDILESGKLDHKPEKKAQHFYLVKKEANRLLQLTNRILTISKSEEKQLKLAKQQVYLPDMIDDLIAVFTLKATKPTKFSTQLKAEMAFADEEYLQEAISNLIDNATKYSKESILIEISSTATAKETIIKVKDNGIGISSEDQTRIFEKFERTSTIEQNRKGKPSGFGLGLSYVQHVIEAHGGWVEVNSKKGGFSEFSIHLTNEK